MENTVKSTTELPAPEAYPGRPGSLAIIVLSVIIPGLVILFCLIISIFLCWHRDRIPIFRTKAQKYSSPGANKTQVPYNPQGGRGYPTQSVPLQKSSAAGAEESMIMEEGGVAKDGVDDKKSRPSYDVDMVVAVDD